jgi:hypothetical protein
MTLFRRLKRCSSLKGSGWTLGRSAVVRIRENLSSHINKENRPDGQRDPKAQLID